MKKELLATALAFCVMSSANAYTPKTIETDTNLTYQFGIYDPSDKPIEDDGDVLYSPFAIPDSYLSPLYETAKTWADIIYSGNKAKSTVKYNVFSFNEYNASAASIQANTKKGDIISPYKISLVNAAINGYEIIEDADTKKFPHDGLILFGLGITEEHPGWAQYTGKHALYKGEISDLYTVMEHEIMHSLGLSDAITQYHEAKGDKKYYFSRGINDNLALLDKDFRVYTGTTEIVPQKGMVLGKYDPAAPKAGTFDPITFSPYYVGKETMKVLSTGKDPGDTPQEAIMKSGGLKNYSSAYDTKNPDYSSCPIVYGLPMHPTDLELDDFDYEAEDAFDMSHIELRNSFMSHQSYRNWLIPMEAELSVLKDLGYDIDLRKYFGKSYYMNGVTDTFEGYSEWNGTNYTGEASKIDQGVGLHIYGDNNTITQTGNINTKGTGAFGVRIDGSNNTYTLNSGKSITTRGKENIGLGVTWGENHTINIASGAAIIADNNTSKDGIGIGFDFGDSIFGSTSITRGSYINYSGFSSMSSKPVVETDTPLISELNLAGSVTGSKAAIYIADNAHVKDINLLDGATINGDIISEWNSVKAGLAADVQRKDSTGKWKSVDPRDVSQIYFTDINIKSGNEIDITGSINGNNGIYNTLKLNNAGTLNIGGDLRLYSAENTGKINITGNSVLSLQSNQLTDSGSSGIIDVADDKTLTLMNSTDSTLNIDNTISLNDNSVLSTLNDIANTTQIDQIEINYTNPATKSKIAFDWGDTITATITGTDANVYAVNVPTKVHLSTGSEFTLFGSNTLTLNGLDDAFAAYINGGKYQLEQAGAKIKVSDTPIASGFINDAVKDTSTIPTIVYEVTDGETFHATATDADRTIQNTNFTIQGNGKTITAGSGAKGIIIDNNSYVRAQSTTFSGFSADATGAIDNQGELALDNVIFDNTNTVALHNEAGGTIDATDSRFDSEIVNDGTLNIDFKALKKAVYNEISGAGTTNVNVDDTNSVNWKVTNGITQTSGVIFNGSGHLNLSGGTINANITNNMTGNTLTIVDNKVVGDIINTGAASHLELQAGASVSGIIKNDGTVSITGGDRINAQQITENITGMSGTVRIEAPNDFTVNKPISNNNLVLDTGHKVYFTNPSTSISTSNLEIKDATINLQNGTYDTLSLQTLKVKNVDAKILMDAEVVSESMDKLYVTAVSNSLDDTIVIETNMPTQLRKEAGTTRKFTLSPISDSVLSSVQSKLAKSLDVKLPKRVEGPVFKYNTSYNSTTGLISVTAPNSGKYSDYSPSAFVAPVASQVGFMNQLNNYTEAFVPLDNLMITPSNIRTTANDRNKYAANGVFVTYDPNQLPEENAGVWFNPYAAYDSVGLKGGPKAKDFSYGGLVGLDLGTKEYKNGWNGLYNIYAGYNGNHTRFDGQSMYYNGGVLGVTGVWYRKNFFTGLTANVGAGGVNASTTYGSEDFAMLTSGVASKTGYNWELFNGNFIIQSSMMMAYSFINTFDYTNTAGIRIKSDPLNAITLQPGLKFIGNTKSGWQPYAGVSMVWNILDRTHVKAQDVNLPNMSIKPYVQYGVGIKKSWGDSFTGYIQTMLRNGGRNGIALNLGLKWVLGKKNK